MVKLYLTDITADVTPVQLLDGKLQPASTENQTFHLLAFDWPFLSQNQTSSHLTDTIYPTLLEVEEALSDSSLSYIRLIF